MLSETLIRACEQSDDIQNGDEGKDKQSESESSTSSEYTFLDILIFKYCICMCKSKKSEKYRRYKQVLKEVSKRLDVGRVMGNHRLILSLS